MCLKFKCNHATQCAAFLSSGDLWGVEIAILITDPGTLDSVWTNVALKQHLSHMFQNYLHLTKHIKIETVETRNKLTHRSNNLELPISVLTPLLGFLVGFVIVGLLYILPSFTMVALI